MGQFHHGDHMHKNHLFLLNNVFLVVEAFCSESGIVYKDINGIRALYSFYEHVQIRCI